jgi:hypothetical protein
MQGLGQIAVASKQSFNTWLKIKQPESFRSWGGRSLKCPPSEAYRVNENATGWLVKLDFGISSLRLGELFCKGSLAALAVIR